MTTPRQARSAAPRIAPRHALADGGQQIWIGFGGRADRLWMRLLRPGFRHCFAVLGDARGWTVVEPLSGRLLISQPDVAADFDLPGFYRRAGLEVLGPFQPGGAFCGVVPGILPYSCVSVCRALLGKGAPRALTPWGLFRQLRKMAVLGKKSLTGAVSASKKALVNG